MGTARLVLSAGATKEPDNFYRKHDGNMFPETIGNPAVILYRTRLNQWVSEIPVIRTHEHPSIPVSRLVRIDEVNARGNAQAFRIKYATDT
jgi:hypothetical protein